MLMLSDREPGILLYNALQVKILFISLLTYLLIKILIDNQISDRTQKIENKERISTRVALANVS